VEIVGAFGAEGSWFDSTSSRHVGNLGKSFTRNCLYDGCSCLAAKFDSCNSLLSSVHTLIVNILRCFRLYIKRKYYYYYYTNPIRIPHLVLSSLASSALKSTHLRFSAVSECQTADLEALTGFCSD